ncbi:hypothetical protein AYI68_g7676 [Smittium mucronatum]|uniref:Protein SPT2-like protein n=1 Tax=Smittium mucronatum TaxID=133383 RepID=A0A1R0GN23_9FUNG|nr:hypothetical protein AYI68_g7676 [Smittium mucronatum]
MLFEKLLSQAKTLPSSAIVSRTHDIERERRLQKEKQEIARKRELAQNSKRNLPVNSLDSVQPHISSRSSSKPQRPSSPKSSSKNISPSSSRPLKSPNPIIDRKSAKDPHSNRPNPNVRNHLGDSSNRAPLSYKELISLAPKKGLGIVKNSSRNTDLNDSRPYNDRVPATSFSRINKSSSLSKSRDVVEKSNSSLQKSLPSRDTVLTPESRALGSTLKLNHRDPPLRSRPSQSASESSRSKSSQAIPKSRIGGIASNSNNSKPYYDRKDTNIPSLSLPNKSKRPPVSEVDRYNIKKTSGFKRPSQSSKPVIDEIPAKRKKSSISEPQNPKPRPPPPKEIDRFGVKSRNPGLSKYSNREPSSFSEYKSYGLPRTKKPSHSSNSAAHSKYSHDQRRPKPQSQPRNYSHRYRDDDYDDDGYGSLDDFIVDDDEEPEDVDYRKEIRKLTGYDRRRYDNDYDTDDMEVSTSAQLREENISLKIAKLEDKIEEKRLMELEELENKRLAKKKR